MKEIFLYSGVYNWTVQSILEQMNAIGADVDITYRTNTGGGDVFAAQGWLASLKTRSGKNIQAIEGNASSMGFFSALYMDKVTALETSECLVHRADMYCYDDEDRNMLQRTNDTFKELMKQRIDVAAFEKRVGMTIDAFFDCGKDGMIRHEVWLSAKDLVAIGLVKEEDVLKLTPEIEASIKANKIAFGEYRAKHLTATFKNEIVNNNNNNNNTIMELTNEQVLQAERERVAAWNVWAKVDADKVLAGIASGNSITPAQSQEFMLALAGKNALTEIEKNSTKEIDANDDKKVEAESKSKVDEDKKSANADLNALLADMGCKTIEA
jgi:ATP-dependent protease ClpP protease subunit